MRLQQQRQQQQALHMGMAAGARGVLRLTAVCSSSSSSSSSSAVLPVATLLQNSRSAMLDDRQQPRATPQQAGGTPCLAIQAAAAATTQQHWCWQHQQQQLPRAHLGRPLWPGSSSPAGAQGLAPAGTTSSLLLINVPRRHRHHWQQPPHPAAFSVSSHSSSSSSGAASSLSSQPDGGGGSSSSDSSSDSPPPLPGVEHISSSANPYIKHCVRLRERARYRQQQRRLLLVGATLLGEVAAEAGSLNVVVLFLRPGAALPPGVCTRRVVTVSDGVMRKLTGLDESGGVTAVAELALPDYQDLLGESSTKTNPSAAQADDDAGGQATPVSATARRLERLLVLEGVQDPGNVGTLLRCALAFGWDAVWLLPGCADPWGDKVLRASRGAALRCPLAAGSLQQLLELVARRGMLLLAAEPEEQGGSCSAPSDAEPAAVSRLEPGGSDGGSSGGAGDGLGRPVCLVLGTEGAGLSQEVLAAATPLAVPMPGGMESLNVGVAGGILLFALSSGGLATLAGRLAQLRLLPPLLPPDNSQRQQPEQR